MMISSKEMQDHIQRSGVLETSEWLDEVHVFIQEDNGRIAHLTLHQSSGEFVVASLSAWNEFVGLSFKYDILLRFAIHFEISKDTKEPDIPKTKQIINRA